MMLISFEKMPNFLIYMDQLLEISNNSLNLIEGTDKITKSMINNYVKMGMLKAPEKKKYGKSHIAGVILISYLKYVTSLENIKKVIKDENMEVFYEQFRDSLLKNFENPLREKNDSEKEFIFFATKAIYFKKKMEEIS